MASLPERPRRHVRSRVARRTSYLVHLRNLLISVRDTRELRISHAFVRDSHNVDFDSNMYPSRILFSEHAQSAPIVISVFESAFAAVLIARPY